VCVCRVCMANVSLVSVSHIECVVLLSIYQGVCVCVSVCVKCLWPMCVSVTYRMRLLLVNVSRCQCVHANVCLVRDCHISNVFLVSVFQYVGVCLHIYMYCVRLYDTVYMSYRYLHNIHTDTHESCHMCRWLSFQLPAAVLRPPRRMVHLTSSR